MVKLVNQTIFAAKIKEKKLYLFSSKDIRALFGVSITATAGLLHRYKKRGFIMQVKRGLYAFHGVIPETVYEITSVTTKSTRRFEVKPLGKVFSYRKIKKAAYTGHEIQKQKGVGFYIADPEKAFVDVNYFRILNKQKPISRFHKEKLNAEKALRYAKLFNNEKLTSIIKTTLK